MKFQSFKLLPFVKIRAILHMQKAGDHHHTRSRVSRVACLCHTALSLTSPLKFGDM